MRDTTRHRPWSKPAASLASQLNCDSNTPCVVVQINQGERLKKGQGHAFCVRPLQRRLGAGCIIVRERNALLERTRLWLFTSRLRYGPSVRRHRTGVIVADALFSPRFALSCFWFVHVSRRRPCEFLCL